jgi:ATP-binding protein involved in chromosome partitioning
VNSPTRDAIDAALATVEDPEIHRPLPELGMIKSVDISQDGVVAVAVYLTVSGCPMRSTIVERVSTAVSAVPGVTRVDVELDVMDDEMRKNLRVQLRGRDVKEIPFSKPGSLTKVIAVASGKGGVGKSSLTANLAVALAAKGLHVGLVDADVYGHSIPRMLGITAGPTVVEGMLMPPQSHGVRCISMLPFKPGGASQAIAFRGPMLHRALEQFLTDVWWGDLDVLLLDLPPGTGDVAISVGQLLPTSQLLVVTTPQAAAAEVAVRSGMLAAQTNQRVMGVVENMSAFPCPHCGEPIEVFGSGGGDTVAATLSAELGSTIPVLGRIPFDPRLGEGNDAGAPLVLSEPTSPAASVILQIADGIVGTPRGLLGMQLQVSPSRA